MRSTNLYLMQGTTIISTVMTLSDLLRSTNGHPEMRRLKPAQQQVVRTILTEELKFQREQLNKLLEMVTR
jgi:hypothetical protein